MMVVLSSEQALVELTGTFGPDDAILVQNITNRVSQLHDEWRLFLYLFCGPKERVSELNAASGRTARTLQNALWDKAILTVRALTDDSKDGKGNKNLSLHVLCGIANKQTVDLLSRWQDIKTASKNCRDYADKYIAHRDHDHMLGNKALAVTRKDLTDVIRFIGEFVSEFHDRTRSVDLKLLPIKAGNDEQSFLASLYFGNLRRQSMQEEETKELRSGGKIDRSEYKWPDWIFAKEFDRFDL